MYANIERVYDELEREALKAIMYANAANSQKKIKSSDLFERPSNKVKAKSRAETMQERQDRAVEYLSRFEEFQGKFD